MLQSLNASTKYLTVGQAAEILGVSPWTLRNWDKAGKLKPMRDPKSGYRIYRHEDLQAVLDLPDAADVDFSPRVDWSEMGEAEHFVQFYESDGFLVDSVSGFVAAALQAGEGAVVIATEAHRQAIQLRLEARGIDVARALSASNFVSLDAAETLSKFMVSGSPDPRLFNQVVGSLVAQLAEGGRRVRAFGEMVAILWEQGNRAAAVRLEELWNELQKTQTFALFCAYPIEGFSDDSGEHKLSDVCKCHSRVIPAESYAGQRTNEDRIRAIASLQQKAQSLEAEIAHRKEVEKALARRERELEDFFENASEGLHRVGPDGIILWANKAELELLGYAPEEYIGHHISQFHVDREVIDDMLAKLLRGDSLSNAPTRLRCKDGSIKHVLISSNSYFQDGTFIYTRCFTRDITSRIEAEELQRQLLDSERAARAEAERLSRMKDEFLATLSHELRTPLNAINGWTQIIKDSSDVQTVAEGIAVIDRNVRIQTRLIEDLLDMSRIISGKVRLDVQPVDLAHLLRAAVEAVQPSADANGIQLHLAIGADVGQVMGDSGRLHQIVWNLLTNAVKFTPRDGRIELRLARVNSQAQITVSDTGQGIHPDFLPHIFQRFRQADSSTTRRHGGLGLGLSIVKQLVQLHGGTCRVHSDGIGKGATFTISLPLPLDNDRAQNQQPSDTNRGTALDCSSVRLDGVTVLVVDDEPDARRLVARLLADRDADVLTASNAREAIELLKLHKPDVLVSDIGMPEMDGYQLIRQVRALPATEGKSMPAVALTAFARSEDRTRAMLAGYQAHLSKPLEPHELIATVATLAGRTGPVR